MPNITASVQAIRVYICKIHFCKFYMVFKVKKDKYFDMYK